MLKLFWYTELAYICFQEFGAHLSKVFETFELEWSKHDVVLNFTEAFLLFWMHCDVVIKLFCNLVYAYVQVS